MTKKKESPNHHMGKYTGYDLIDGVYHIAPMYNEKFIELSQRKKGIDDLLSAISRFAFKEYENINKENGKTWNRISEDIGINLADSWLWNNNGIIYKKEEEQRNAEV